MRPALPLLLALAGCPPVDDPYLPYPTPSFEGYVGRIQPIVQTSCASLGCHGTTERALTLYAVDALRAPPPVPTTPLDPDALTAGELAWNYDALRMRLIDEESAETSRLLRKCLPPAQGGIAHADGVVVFESREDARYRAFAEWIDEAL